MTLRNAFEEMATQATLAAILTAQQAAGDFKRLAKAEPMPGEELRFDDVAAGDLFIGAAPALTATSATVWKVVKYTRDAAGKVTRLQFKTAIAWDNRSSAGNWA